MKLRKLIAATFTTVTLGLALASTSTLAQEIKPFGLNPGDNADVTHFSHESIHRAEKSLNKSNCALFLRPRSRIVCAYGDAGSRSRLLAAIQHGNARSFTGDGSTLSGYIKHVGANQVATDLSNLGIGF
jgi:hypothetical protein